MPQDEIRCPKCGTDDFSADFVDWKKMDALVCTCSRCKFQYTVPTLDAPTPEVRGRSDGYYWIRLNDVAAKEWEVAYWDGRVWARCADADPVDESEIQTVGPKIPGYTGG